jgi:hypothetical protein
MQGPAGQWVFFFNHSSKPATVEFSRELESPASHVREIMTDQQLTQSGTSLHLTLEVPAESVRVYRIDFEAR